MPHEFDGEQYRRASAHQKEWGARLIEELKLTGDERVLDLGCGDGALTARIAALVPGGRALGIDASAGMIASARRLSAPNLEFRLLDINDLPFEAEFDVVFSNATLHWVKDHGRLLENVHRALRDGGRARFNFAGAGNCANLLRVVSEVTALPRYAPLFADFEQPWFMPAADEYRGILQRSPFRRFEVWDEVADRSFPDAQAMTLWIENPSLVPFLEHLPAQDRRAFRDLVVDAMIRATRRPGGTCFETFRRINVLAVRTRKGYNPAGPDT